MGQIKRKAFSTIKGSTMHAEELGRKFMINEKIPFENIKRIYSELEPCGLSKPNCKGMLEHDFPFAPIEYSYKYPGTDHLGGAERRASIALRTEELKKLLNQ